MITQTITASMTQTHLSKILTRRYDVGREIKFILYKDELLSDPIDLTDYTVVITVIKPDNNFVIENFVGDTVTITDQMEVVTGTGYYCVHVTKDTETIYTGQGEFIIDDVLISDDELESISEVNGLRFPDDFLTIDDHIAVIDDDVTRTDKTWSSSKISYEIENVSVIVSKIDNGNPIELTDAADAPLVKCVTAITGYQSGTGTPSPDNIRPITAYTEGEIEVRGKNIYDYTKKNTSNGFADSSYLLSNGTIGSSGNWEISEYIEIPNFAHSVVISGIGYGSDPSICFYDTSKSYISGEAYSGTSNKAYIISSGAVYVRFSVPRATESNVSLTASTTHTTTYPSAIYRGSEDVVNGEVTTEKLVYTISDATGVQGLTALTNVTRVIIDINATQLKSSGTHISNYLEYVANYTLDEPHFYFDSNNRVVAFFPGVMTGGQWRAYIESNPLQIAYEVNPTTSSVTPTNLPIKSLSGYTHIDSSTGDMEIEYITHDYQPLVDSIEKESGCRTTKLWDAGFTPSPGVWLEYDFGEDLEAYDAIVILFVVSGWEGNNADSVTVYPKIQNLNTNKYYHYITGDYGIQFWRVSGTTYGLGSINGNYPPQYKAVYGIKY